MSGCHLRALSKSRLIRYAGASLAAACRLAQVAAAHSALADDAGRISCLYRRRLSDCLCRAAGRFYRGHGLFSRAPNYAGAVEGLSDSRVGVAAWLCQ